MLEAYTALGWLAAKTERVKLLAMVTAVVYREPGLLAKAVTTLDVLSGGRAILGIGAAWNEDESKGLGLLFPPVSERFERLEEAILIMKQMWSGAAGPFDGKHYHLARTLNSPQVLPQPHLPILIGGGGEQVKKTLRLVAKYADACNIAAYNLDDTAHKLDVLRQHCVNEGRDYDEIEKTAQFRYDLGENGENVNKTIEHLHRVSELGFSAPGARLACCASASLVSSTCSPSRSSLPWRSSSTRRGISDHTRDLRVTTPACPSNTCQRRPKDRGGASRLGAPRWCRCPRSRPGAEGLGARHRRRARRGSPSAAPTAHLKVFLARMDGQHEPHLPEFTPDGRRVRRGCAPRPTVRTLHPAPLRPGEQDAGDPVPGARRGPRVCEARSGPSFRRQARGRRTPAAGSRFEPVLGPLVTRLAADESAIPAVGTLLEALLETATVDVHPEVEGPDDEIEFAGPGMKTSITWHRRARRATPSARDCSRRPARRTSSTAPGSGWPARRPRCATSAAHFLADAKVPRGIPVGQLVTRGYWRAAEQNHPGPRLRRGLSSCAERPMAKSAIVSGAQHMSISPGGRPPVPPASANAHVAFKASGRLESVPTWSSRSIYYR